MMALAALVAAATLQAATAPPETARPPEKHKPLGSLVPRPREPAETAELAAAAVVLQKFADCVVEKEARAAAAAVDLPLHTPESYRAAQVQRMKNRMSICLGRQNGANMQAGMTLMVGAFAEQLYRRRFPSLPPLTPVTIPPASHPSQLAAAETRRFADCLIERDPKRIDALARSEVGSSEESAAFATLGGEYGTCLDAGSTLKINRLTLRFALADQLYRRALAGSAVAPARKAAR